MLRSSSARPEIGCEAPEPFVPPMTWLSLDEGGVCGGGVGVGAGVVGAGAGVGVGAGAGEGVGVGTGVGVGVCATEVV